MSAASTQGSEFIHALDRPTSNNPRLRRLLATKPHWER
ncbi:hypothetical protein BH23GEM10_BH23GEM10_10680 [soil metagenome]